MDEPSRVDELGRVDEVAEALAVIERRDFLPAAVRSRSGLDQPLEIGFGQTNSQPRTVADMLRMLGVRARQRVLDVGSGSGWTTALLAQLVGPSGLVVGVERIADLVAMGRANLAAYRLPQARIEQAHPSRLGWPDKAPYDRILVSAQAQQLPGDLVEQLAPGGVMVLPVGGRMLRITRGEQGPQVKAFGCYRFVPLIVPTDEAVTRCLPAESHQATSHRPE